MLTNQLGLAADPYAPSWALSTGFIRDDEASHHALPPSDKSELGRLYPASPLNHQSYEHGGIRNWNQEGIKQILASVVFYPPIGTASFSI